MPDNLPVLSRPRDGAMLGGVCAGLARRWRVDPNLLRIAAVVLAFFGGLGVAGYVGGLLLMPRDGSAELPIRRLLPFTRSWPTGGVVAATIGALVVLVGLTTGSSGIGLGPLVVLFFVFVAFRGRAGRGTSGPSPEPTPFERAADAWRVRLAEQHTPGYEGVPLAAVATAPAEQRWTQPYTDPATDLAVRDNEPPAVLAERRLRRQRWRLWWLALALAGAAVVVVAVLGMAGLPTTPLAYAAAVLGALGLTLVIAAPRGRPPLLLPATLIAGLVTAGLLVPVTGVPHSPKFGELRSVYTDPAEVPAVVDYSAGDVQLDLSRLQLTADHDLAIHVGAGSVDLTLPKDVATELTWKVRAGDFTSVDGSGRDGFDLSGTESFPATTAGAPTLRITVNVELGEVDVKR